MHRVPDTLLGPHAPGRWLSPRAMAGRRGTRPTLTSAWPGDPSRDRFGLKASFYGSMSSVVLVETEMAFVPLPRPVNCTVNPPEY
jgi:hypothetical protein